MEAFYETRKPKVLKPDVPLDKQWINDGSGEKWTAYCDKFNEVNGPDSDPAKAPI